MARRRGAQELDSHQTGDEDGRADQRVVTSSNEDGEGGNVLVELEEAVHELAVQLSLGRLLVCERARGPGREQSRRCDEHWWLVAVTTGSGRRDSL